jgi:hypothetical protein
MRIRLTVQWVAGCPWARFARFDRCQGPHLVTIDKSFFAISITKLNWLASVRHPRINFEDKSA